MTRSCEPCPVAQGFCSTKCCPANYKDGQDAQADRASAERLVFRLGRDLILAVNLLRNTDTRIPASLESSIRAFLNHREETK